MQTTAMPMELIGLRLDGDDVAKKTGLDGLQLVFSEASLFFHQLFISQVDHCHSSFDRPWSKNGSIPRRIDLWRIC